MLRERILELAKEEKMTHVGSYLSAVDIIDEIYTFKNENEPFILSSGHAFLAQQVVMEKHGIPIGATPTHPESRMNGVEVSTGSLGQGLPIAVGMALANRMRRVWCLISDGECAEGSIWEALRIADEQRLENLKVYVNSNGWSAYGEVDQDKLEARLKAFFPVRFRRTNSDFGDIKGLDAHYKPL